MATPIQIVNHTRQRWFFDLDLNAKARAADKSKRTPRKVLTVAFDAAGDPGSKQTVSAETLALLGEQYGDVLADHVARERFAIYGGTLPAKAAA